jgi:hypothetical protein
MHNKSLLALSLTLSCCICFASDVTTSCEKPEIQKRIAVRAPQPSISVQCGSNTNTQTVAPSPTQACPVVPSANPQAGGAQPNPIYVALVAGAAGVLGAASGAFASIWIARRNSQAQLKLEELKLTANVVTQERLRWLQDIRGRLAKLYRDMDMQYSHLQRPVASGDEKLYQELLDTAAPDIMEQCHLITLMLNPSKPDQAALRNAIQSAMAFLASCYAKKTNDAQSFNDREYQSIKHAAFDALTKIGVTTWTRIKELN